MSRIEIQLKKEVHSGLAGVKAQLVGMAADITESAARAPMADPAGAVTTLIDASNQHAANAQKMAAAIHDVHARVAGLEKSTTAITSLQATVDSLDNAVKTALARISALGGSSPAIPTIADPAVARTAVADVRAIVEAVLNENGKRGRANNASTVEDGAKRHHMGIVVPAALALPTAPPAPDFASPAFMQPTPALQVLAPAAPVSAAPLAIAPAALPVAPPAPTALPPAPLLGSGLPRAPPHRDLYILLARAHFMGLEVKCCGVHLGTGGHKIDLRKGPERCKKDLPREHASKRSRVICNLADAAGPPRVRIDPAREVLLGPMDWEAKWNQTPRNLVLAVLGHATMRTARFTSRRGHDDVTAVIVFDAANVAEWFIGTWNGSPRTGFEQCTARAALNV
ncbi:hypothetical protein B0H12DRAFT_1079079 [Mycena haematopus]|nr:hypothetical protein B0H12DRAFT_1079079 [Mycena haematopus]